MLKYIKGNIFESDAQALVNTVNTEGVMGKGLALQFQERFPENYKIYREVCMRGGLKVGQVLVTDYTDLTGTRYIINFPTKSSWRKPSSYSYIEEGLAALKKELTARNISSVAIPPLGSRNGGLDWNRVKPMIESSLGDIDCEIIIYEPSDVILERMKSERVKLTPARAMMLSVMFDMIHQGEFVSEFAAEKIVYFLQRFGAGDCYKLTFNPAYYGPFSGKVRYVLRHMNGSYLMGLQEMNNLPFEPIWMIADTESDVRSFVDSLDPRYKDVLDKTTGFLDGFYSNYSLELLATVDYILCHDERMNDWALMDRSKLLSIVEEDIKRWSSRKERLFGEEEKLEIVIDHLSSWWDRMPPSGNNPKVEAVNS